MPMIIHHEGNCLELCLSEQLPLEGQGAGDTRFNLRVRVRGQYTVLSAESWTWVEASVLAAFAQQLRALQENRQQSAVLESMSPGELRLEIRSYDRAGHVGAFGQVGHWFNSGVSDANWSVISFGIPFCPSELPGLVREFDNLLSPNEAKVNSQGR